jgi:hypothetical protein
MKEYRDIILEAEAKTVALDKIQKFKTINEAYADNKSLTEVGQLTLSLQRRWIELLEDNSMTYRDRVRYVELHEGWWDDLKMYASVLAKPVLNLVAQFNPVTRAGAALISAIDSAMDGKWKDAAQNLAGVIPGGKQLVAAFQAAGDAKSGDVAGFVTSLAKAVTNDPTLNAAATAVNAYQLGKELMPGQEPTQTAAAPKPAQQPATAVAQAAPAPQVNQVAGVPNQQPTA